MDLEAFDADAIVFTQPATNLNPDASEDEAFMEEEGALQQARGSSAKKAKWADKESMYVRLFTEMLDTVLEKEAFLFSDPELELFQRFRELNYPARFLLVRLTLRKEAKWHRSDDLIRAYGENITDIPAAMKELCMSLPSSPSAPANVVESKPLSAIEPRTVKEEEIEYIMIDDDDEEPCQSSAFKCPSSALPFNVQEPKPEAETQGVSYPKPPLELLLWFLAQDDSHASIEDMCDTLVAKELKQLAKELKVASGKMKRTELIAALVKHSSKQTSLSHFLESSSKNKTVAHDAKPSKQCTLDSFRVNAAPKLQTSRLRSMVRKITGPCLRINMEIFKLIQRLNLVYFRSFQPTQPLLPVILANTKKSSPRHRTYPSYIAHRTADIFRSRETLLAYEEAIILESQIDEALAKLSRVEGAERVVGLFRPAYQRWIELVAAKDEDTSRHGALVRFGEGHVLTRIVYKGAQCHGVLKQLKTEKEVLWGLLDQKKWRIGSRGKWYERLALLLMKDTSERSLWEAKEVVEQALNDPNTHLIYRSALERRLRRLEKSLKTPEEDRYQSDWILKKCPHLYITGRRIREPLSESTPIRTIHEDEIIEIDTPRRPPVKAGSLTPHLKLANNPSAVASSSRATSAPMQPSWQRDQKESTSNRPVEAEPNKTGKSVWKGEGDHVSVEEFALEYYQRLGYNGFHSEGRIVHHLFTLLFWSILFDSDIPGAFETPFQMAPLDLVHDSFYYAREEKILARLKEIEDGGAEALIETTDDRERPSKTCAIGLRWDDYSKEDVLGIARGLGGKGLSTICRLLCEEYAQRGSGVPDLIVWKSTEAKFVEVKGPGDTLQENQKVWIDVMVGSAIPVEVCHVEEEGFELAKTTTRKSLLPQHRAARFKKGSSRPKIQRRSDKENTQGIEDSWLPSDHDEASVQDEYNEIATEEEQEVLRTPCSKRAREEPSIASVSKRRKSSPEV